MLTKRKNNVRYVKDYLLGIILIISAPTVFLTRNVRLIYSILFLLLIIYCLLTAIKKNVVRKRELYYSITYFVFASIIVLFENHYSTLTGIYILYACFPLMLYIILRNWNFSLQNILNSIVVISVVLGILSVILWLMGPILNIVRPINYINFTWGSSIRRIANYYYLYFQTQGYNIFLKGIHISARNTSIFAEAPFASFYYSTILILNEFVVRKNRKAINGILLIVLLTTMSLSGYLMVILFSMYLVVNIHASNKIIKLLKVVLVITFSILAIFLVVNLVSGKLQQSSGIVRVGKITEEIKAFISSPLVGNGFNRYTNGSSNSFFALLADGGIILWGFYYLPIIIRIIDVALIYKRIDYCSLLFLATFIFTCCQYYPYTVFVIDLFWAQVYDKHLPDLIYNVTPSH